MSQSTDEFCKLYYNSTFCPITYYRAEEEVLCAFPNTLDYASMTKSLLPFLLKQKKNPDYYITKSFCYIGIIRIKKDDSFLVVGPMVSTTPNRKTIHEMMHEFALPYEKENDLFQYLLETPRQSFNQFLATLAFLHLCLNGEQLDCAAHFSISDSSSLSAISALHSSQTYQAKEEQQFHNSYLFEQQYLGFIRDGQPEQLKKLLSLNAASLTEGNIAYDTLRQAKNIMIVSTTLATRSAISGGLDIEAAYQLSDIYIKEAEKTQSLESLQNLQFNIILDFANRVAQNKVPNGMSRELFECVQYISSHTNEPIRVEDVANHIHRSRSYISQKFKKELGFDLNTFIMRCKLEEAKSLLTYSDKSLSEISNYLCFSSQAYFQNVFKKKYDMTPNQYRKISLHSSLSD